MKRVVLAALALALAACAPVEQAGPTAPQPEATATTESACVARGGRWQRVGRAQTFQCVTTYADAGRACTDGAACQSGRCLGAPNLSGQTNVSGQCQATNMMFGCYTRIVNGRAEAAICVD